MIKEIYKRITGSSFLRVLAAMEIDEAMKTLDVSLEDLENSSDLKDAYKKAAMEHHPDRGGSAEEMKKVNEAYELLKNTKLTPKSSRVDYGARAAKYRAAQKEVNAELLAKFKPEVYAEYFEKVLGKTFKASPLEWIGTDDNSPYYGGFNIEWSSADGETVFSAHFLVDLIKVVWSGPKLGSGEDHVTSFSVEARTTILHNRRKVKFTQRTWESKELSKGLNDPTILFPKDKLLKKVQNKKAGTKVTRKDMFLVLNKKLGAQVYKDAATIPLNVVEKTKFGQLLGLSFYIWRSVFMKQAVWSFRDVTFRLKDENGKVKVKKADLKTNSLPESDKLIDLLIEVQSHLSEETDPEVAARFIDQKTSDLREELTK